MTKPTDASRALDKWARDTGYSSFDTYIATGGSIREARDDLVRQRDQIALAIDALSEYRRQTAVAAAEVVPRQTTVGPEALSRLEAEASGAAEPIDTGNAHPQGAEHAC